MTGEDVLLVDGVGNVIAFRVMNAESVVVKVPVRGIGQVEFVRTETFQDGHRIFRQAGYPQAVLRRLRQVAA